MVNIPEIFSMGFAICFWLALAKKQKKICHPMILDKENLRLKKGVTIKTKKGPMCKVREEKLNWLGEIKAAGGQIRLFPRVTRSRPAE